MSLYSNAVGRSGRAESPGCSSRASSIVFSALEIFPPPMSTIVPLVEIEGSALWSLADAIWDLLSVIRSTKHRGRIHRVHQFLIRPLRSNFGEWTGDKNALNEKCFRIKKRYHRQWDQGTYMVNGHGHSIRISRPRSMRTTSLYIGVTLLSEAICRVKSTP